MINNSQNYDYPMSITSQFYFCGMPFRLDSYKDCPTGCIYCYSKSRRGNFRRKRQYANPQKITKLFDKILLKRGKPKNVIEECIKRRVPIHFGGMSDPLLIPSSYRHITHRILEVLDHYEYPTLISTKAAFFNNHDIAKILLGKKHFALQFSFSTFDDNLASLAEPFAPPPKERLRTAREALACSNWVSCRFQPFFPGQNIRKILAIIDSTSFRYLTIEHFKLPFDGQKNYRKIASIFKLDIEKLFPQHERIKRGREFEMPFNIRLDNILELIEISSKISLPIGVGDNGFQHLSSSECCCGTDKIPGFENWLKHNTTVAVRKTPKSSLIRYENIEKNWTPTNSIARMINSKCRLGNGQDNIKNHIRNNWIHNLAFSPRMFYGVEAEHINGIYLYKKIKEI